MFKRIVALMLAAAMCIFMIACGSPNETSSKAVESTPEGTQKDVDLYILASQTAFSPEMFDELVKGFEKAFPNIHVELETTMDDAQVLAARIAGGKIPNLLRTGVAYPDEMFEDGQVLDMHEVFSMPAYDSNGTVLDSLVPGSEFAKIQNGISCGLPTDPGVAAWVLNKTWFEEEGWAIPTNWDELIAVTKEINKAGYTPLAWGGLGSSENRLEMSAWISGVMAAGGDDYMKALDNLEVGAWAEKAVYGYEMIKELYDNGVIDKTGLGMDCPQSQVAFVQRKYPMVISGYWFEAEMADQLTGDELLLIAAPLNKNGSKTKYYNSWYNSWMAYKSGDAAVDEATKNFLRYLVSYEFQNKMITAVPLVANRKVMAEYAQRTDISKFAASVGTMLADENNVGVNPSYMSWYYGSLRVPYHIDVINSVAGGLMTPQEAGAAMEAQAQIVRDDDNIVKQHR